MTFYTTPILTIGIPVYNGEKTIKETLDCCSKLSADLVRVVISDNGSNDDTYNIALGFVERFQHISVYRHEQNVGAANNFKFLLDSCSSEYFMWLAADDVISSDLSIDELVYLFKRYPKAMAVSPFAMVGEVGEQVPDRGNRAMVGTRAINTLLYLVRPGVNSRFYSIYRTDRLLALHNKMFENDKGNYFASDIVFSVAVLQQGEWPEASSFKIFRKPGISADGWKLRLQYSQRFWDAVFPSVKFIRQIVGLVPLHEQPLVLMVSVILYMRYLIGPLKHRITKYWKR